MSNEERAHKGNAENAEETAQAWAKFDEGVRLLRESLAVLGTSWEIPDRAHDALSDVLDDHGYMLTDNSPDSRD